MIYVCDECKKSFAFDDEIELCRKCGSKLIRHADKRETIDFVGSYLLVPYDAELNGEEYKKEKLEDSKLLNLAKIFNKHNKAMVFIDYEYCFYSYKRVCDIKPMPSKWIKNLETDYNIADIMVFADFSPTEINAELGKIRSITNTIIETGNTFMHRKKDMTDFIMLDYIYQCADDRNDIDTYIIFTGDGHFQSVVKYLSQKKHKKVVICGVKDTMSRQLQAVADEVIELPVEEEVFFHYCQLIVSNLKYVEGADKIIPTFTGTSEAVAKHNKVSLKEVQGVLHRMIECGYIEQTQKRFGRKIYTTLIPVWDKMKADGLMVE